ncbi:MAG: hypothetical protein J5519_02935 [Bacteroidales bacterium]|nr:hypothetical protein [Bacteroidales bacterium]
MKKIFKYIGIVLSAALMGAFTACTIQEETQSADIGLGIKVFFPTKVVAGQPMTINGSGFSDVKEIVFPDNVTVTDFQVVSGEMIRVKAPSGISSEGGKIRVRTDVDEAESKSFLSLGHTVVSGFSKQEGEEIQGGEQLTIYGEDLEFITGVELLDPDGEPYIVDETVFYRKGTNSVIINIPRKNIFDGAFVGKILTVDGREFSLPEFTYKPASDGGHWEIVKEIVWENDGSHGAINWNGDYRFAGEGFATGEEIATIPADMWERMKSGPFYLKAAINADWYNMRITTGWWSVTYTGADIGKGDERIIVDEDGTFVIELDLSGDPILDVLDQQHLLFTGEGYTPLAIYFEKEEWVGGGGHEEIVRTSIWKNDGSHGNISWNGDYRFSSESNSTGEEIYAIPQDLWDKMKAGTFYLEAAINADWYNMRITTGWWSVTYTGADIGKGDERIILSEDGTKFTIAIDLSGDPILDVLDVQHLLFTGEGYTPLELYFEETVWVDGGGDTPKEVDIWKNDGSHGNISWNGDYRFSSESNSTGEEIYAIPQDLWDKMKAGPFYLEASINADWYNMRITTGWWSVTWTGADIGKGDERIILSDDGTTYKIEINLSGDPILDVLDVQHLLFTGEGYTPLRLYLIE